MSLIKIKSCETLYIVYPAAITSHEFEQAETILNRVWALCGARPVFVCDRNKAPEDVIPAGAPAILVGNNIMPECRQVLADLNYGEGEIRVVGNRIVVATYIDELLVPMISKLADSMSYADGELTFDVPEGKTKDYRYLHLLPTCDGGRVVAYRNGCEETDLVLLADANEDIFRAYVKKLEGFFKLEWQREAHGNLFAAFTNDKAGLHVYYTPYNKCIRAVIEPVANFYVDDTKPYECITTPLMTFMGRRFAYNTRYLGKDSGAGQMSYCIRLSDGSFIVYDGGLATDAFADAIYDVMKEQAPDPDNMVIAAWIITHSHIDHTGGFLKFAPKYSDKVKLERLMYNFPSIKDAEAHREAWNIRLTREAHLTYFPEAKFFKLHTGDIVNVRDAQFEILYTHEDFVRQYLSMVNTKIYNMCSLVARMTLGGDTVMFMGDCQDEANDFIVAMYGEYLKAHILQVCHHGGCGGTVPLYSAIDPEVAIFSTTDELLPEYLAVVYNYKLVYEQNVKQIFNSAENTITLPLPYTVGEYNIPPFEGNIVDRLASSKGCVIATVENGKKTEK